MFKRRRGKSNLQAYLKPASVAIEPGDLFYPDLSGNLQLADATSGNHIGIATTTHASTDSDYASNTEILIDVISDDDVFEVDVDTGTALTAAMVGGYYDLTDHDSINVGAQSKKVVLIDGFISATKALVKIPSHITNKNVEVT